MTSSPLPGDDEDWGLATSIFQILHAFVQPKSKTPPSEAATQLNLLFPHHRISYSDPSSAISQRRSFLQEIWGGTCYIAKRHPAGSASQEKLVELMKCLRDADIEVVQLPALKVMGKETRKDRLIPRKMQRTLTVSEVQRPGMVQRMNTFPNALPTCQRPTSEIVWPKVWLDLPGFLEDVEKVIKGWYFILIYSQYYEFPYLLVKYYVRLGELPD
jgi:hypothetical protein